MGIATLVTREEFLAMPDADDYELIDGELREREAMGLEASVVMSRTDRALGAWEDRTQLGLVFSDGVGLDIFERHYVPRPDGGFISHGRIASHGRTGNLKVAPELVYEVISPGNKAGDTEANVRNYLDAGIDTVWVLYPGARRVHVFRRGERPEILEAGDTLTSELLPGFAAPVASLFSPVD